MPEPVRIEPLVAWPHEAQAGRSYLMTVDLRLSPGSEWRYDAEEYAVICIVSTDPSCTVGPVGEPAVLLHRFGGTYGPAQFLLTALAGVDDARLRLTLVNQAGLPIAAMPLAMRIVDEAEPPASATVPVEATAATLDRTISGATIATLTHSGPVNDVAFSPDGSLLSASSDGTVMLWDVVSRVVTVTIQVRGGPVGAIAAGELGGRAIAVSGSDDRTVRVWDLATGAQRGAPLTGHWGPVGAIAIGELDGRAIAVSGSDDGTVRVWDLATGAQRGAPLSGRRRPVRAIAIGKLDGRAIAVSGTDDGTVWVWDLAAGAQRSELRSGRSHAVNAVAFSPDGRLASASSDGTVMLWDFASGAQRGQLVVRHSGAVNGVAFSPDGRLASASSDGTVMLWDPANDAPTSHLKLREGSDAATALAWGQTDLAVAVASSVMLLRVEGRSAGTTFRGESLLGSASSVTITYEKPSDALDADRLRVPIGSGGRLPSLLDADSIQLGIHPPPGGQLLPYVPRDLDDDLRRALERNAPVVLAGPSVSGKTRSAYEAARAALPDAVLLAPRPGAGSLSSLLENAAVRNETATILLWLDDLDQFVDTAELDRPLVDLVAGKGHLTAVATVREAALDRLLDDPRRLITDAWVGRLSSTLSETELARAQQVWPGGSIDPTTPWGGSQPDMGDAALDVYREAFRVEDDQSAPAAGLELARLLTLQGKGDEALSVDDELDARFGGSPDPSVRQYVAASLVNKGGILAVLGRREEALAVYDDLISRFGGDPENEISHLVANGLVEKAGTLGSLGRFDEAIAVYDDVVARFGTATDPAALEQVARALVGKGTLFGERLYFEEAIAAYDRVLAWFGGATDPGLREQVRMARYNRSIRLGQLNRDW